MSNGKPRTEPTSDAFAQVMRGLVVLVIGGYVLIVASLPVALAIWLWRLALGR